jgi:hypothetical protein
MFANPFASGGTLLFMGGRLARRNRNGKIINKKYYGAKKIQT